MATATKKEITPVPVAPKVEVTLVLSLEEATTIRDIMYLIGGATSTRRRYADSVRHALESALGPVDPVRIPDVNRSQRSIWFIEENA